MTTTPAAPARYNATGHTLGYVTLKNGQTRRAVAYSTPQTGKRYVLAFTPRGRRIHMTPELAATYVVVGPQVNGYDLAADHTEALLEDAERTTVTPEQAAVAAERAQLTDVELTYADQRAAALGDDSDDELEVPAPAAATEKRAADLQVQRGAYHDNYPSNYGPRPSFVPFDGDVVTLRNGHRYIVAAKAGKLRGPIAITLLRMTDGRRLDITAYPSSVFPVSS